MPDSLFRPLPPMANEWILGLASSRVGDGDAEELARAVEGEGEVPAELLEALISAVAATNSAYFRFELDGVVDADEPRLVALRPGDTTVRAGLGLRSDRPTRKLTALQVVRTDGPVGQLVVAPEGKAVDLEVGTVAVIPAFCDARFTGADGARVEVVAAHALGRTFR